MSYIFPHFSERDGRLYDGQLFKLHPFCKENFNSRKCKNFYAKIKGQAGFHICPHGYTVYYSNDDCNLICSIRVKDFFDKKSIGKKKDSLFSPVIEEEILKQYLNDSLLLNRGLHSFKDALHDVRKLNADLKALAEQLQETIYDNAIKEDIKRILGYSGLITTNLDIFDLDINPKLLGIGKPQYLHIYKMFDKTLKCLKYRFNEKKIDANIYGQSNFQKNLPQLFVTIPFIILENAIKYTYTGGKLNIKFYENEDFLNIDIESIESPQVLDDEVDTIFKKGYRGSCARGLLDIKGQGKGLFF